MIQIDDAGSGSFVGGTCIGIYRPETNEYYFDIIPIELYNKENFNRKLYLDAVVDITSAAFRQMNIQPGEAIEICRGYMFEKLKQWLDSREFCWYVTHITGRFQDIVEKSFELYTHRLGLPPQYIQYTRYPFHFHKLLRWVFADYEHRIKLCKVGWKSWEKLQNIELQVTVEMLSSNNFFCLRCGEHIKAGSRVKVIHYCSNRQNEVFIHQSCHKEPPPALWVNDPRFGVVQTPRTSEPEILSLLSGGLVATEDQV